MTELLGVTIHDPDVAFTDLGLAILGAYLGVRLGSLPGQRTLARTGAVLMGGLASAALWGAVFHGFFPAGTSTPSGFLAWVPVALSIAVAASAMLELSLRLLTPHLPPRVRAAVVISYAVCFGLAVLLVSESFTTIVYFYLPALLLLLAGSAKPAFGGSPGWALVVLGLTLSVLAALLQQLRVSIHPTYFDHNAVYHLVQGIALVVLYWGWRRAVAVAG